MAYIHKIQIADEKDSGSTVSSTRKSDRRQYLACIVATTTEATIRIHAEKQERIVDELVDWRIKLEARKAAFGMTIEDAEVWRKRAQERWYNRTDGCFETTNRIRRERGGGRHEELDGLARADMISRGFEDPFDKNGRYGVCEAADEVAHRVAVLKQWAVPTLGSQSVISWHGTVGLARKALAGLDRLRALGDAVDIRTDITITETKKRAAA